MAFGMEWNGMDGRAWKGGNRKLTFEPWGFGAWGEEREVEAKGEDVEGMCSQARETTYLVVCLRDTLSACRVLSMILVPVMIDKIRE